LMAVQLNNSMQLSPWEANSSSANQEIPGILWHPMFHNSVYKSKSLVHILRYINLGHPVVIPWRSILILWANVYQTRLHQMPEDSTLRERYCKHTNTNADRTMDSFVQYLGKLTRWDVRVSVFFRVCKLTFKHTKRKE
jgi:hypothetical protein